MTLDENNIENDDDYIDPLEEAPTVSLTDELGSSYLDYAMSVIVSRALPDLRDGLKPVHRRILYAMHESGNSHDKPYRKSARPVGDVMGKYHPHGDASIYDALVRMTQDFSMSAPLLDGQGNFGSMDGDNAAAMRYTEIRMEKIAQQLLLDIDRNTVDFQDNYDGKDQEPVVLPARFPNILVNGGSGIAVGMASNIPSYNLGEIIDATLELIKNPDVSSETIMQLLPGPDFPTGGVIMGRIGSMQTFLEGKGRVVLRAKTHFEVMGKDGTRIVIDEVPYQVNKASLVEQIVEVARNKQVIGISNIQDESNREGVRVVIELKRDSTPEVVLNQLWRHTKMQSSIVSNLVVLNRGKPELMNISQILQAFIEFREEVITRRTADNLRRARERSHLLCGLAVAISNLDEVVNIIRRSSQPSEAREALMARDWQAEQIADYIKLIDDPQNKINPDNTYRLTETQARAILDLRLQRLTAMGVKENTDELQVLAGKIKDYLDILRSGDRVRTIISEELLEVKDKYSIPRRTLIEEYDEEIEDEDLIPQEEMVVIITQEGYIKRTPLDDYRQQLRGGKGLAGMNTKEEDFVKNLFVANTHDELLCFTTNGLAYKIKTWKLPLGGRNTRGKPLVNVLNVESGVSISESILLSEKDFEDPEKFLIFAFSNGKVRRSALSHFLKIQSNGKIAFSDKGKYTLIGTCCCTESDDIVLASNRGQVIRFSTKLLREIKSRKSKGVWGLKLKKKDHVIGLVSVPADQITSPQRRTEYLKFRRADDEFEEEIEETSLDTQFEDLPLFSEVAPITNEELTKTEELILVITKDGGGKLTSSHEFPAKLNRGGLGVKGNKGKGVIAFMKVTLEDQIILGTNSGQVIRCGVSDVSYRSRTAGGVRIMRLPEDSEIVSVAKIDSSKLPNEEEEEIEEDTHEDVVPTE